MMEKEIRTAVLYVLHGVDYIAYGTLPGFILGRVQNYTRFEVQQVLRLMRDRKEVVSMDSDSPTTEWSNRERIRLTDLGMRRVLPWYGRLWESIKSQWIALVVAFIGWIIAFLT